MASFPDFEQLSDGGTRPLSDSVFQALREAVLVVDASRATLPVILANSAASRCFLGNPDSSLLNEASLYAFLGPATDSAVAAALGTLTSGKSSLNRLLPWRIPRGVVPLSTELQMLEPSPGHPIVMLTFSEPSPDLGLGPNRSAVTDDLPLDLLILDTGLTVIHANGGAAIAASSTVDELLNLSALIVVPTSGVLRERLTDVLEGRHFRDEAVGVTSPGAPTRWFDVDVQPLMDKSTVVGLAVLSMEVTERRRRGRASGADRRLVAVTKYTRDVITVTGRDGRIRYVSAGIERALGYTPAERVAQSIFDQVHPDDGDALQSKFWELGIGSIQSFSQQLRVRHRDGTDRWLELTCVSALDNPLVNGVVTNARDITERKLAEDRGQQREEVFKLAAEAVNGVIFEWDLARGTVERSRGVYDVIGVDPEELEQEGAWSERIHPRDQDAYEGKIALAMASGRGWTATYRIRDVRGRYRSVLERGLIQRGPGGEPFRAIGCAVDVSEVKRITDLLAETQRVAKMGGWEYAYTTRELEWTDELFGIYETTPAEFVVSWPSMMQQCPPDSQLRLKEAISSAEAAHGHVDVEVEIDTLKRRRLWVRVVGHIEFLDGRPLRAFGSVQDIQSQKLAQIALEYSTNWLKLSMGMAHMHAWRWDRATDTLEFAIVDGKMVRTPTVVSGMKKMMSRVHAKDRPMLRRAIDQVFEQAAEVQTEFRLRSGDGSCRAYAAIARPLFDSANQPSGLVGVAQDVTARQEAQERLHRSDALLRTTTANIADTLILVDTDLRVRFINRGIGDWNIEAIVGKDIAMLLPEGARERVLETLRRVLASGDTATYEFEVKAAGGDTRYFDNRAVLVRESNVRTGISITVRDITERKRLEREILDAANRERQKIGRDLHDGLGQELTGVALMLRGLATRLATQCPETLPQVNEIVEQVSRSVQTAQGLARGLLPVATDGGGLTSALHSLADRSREVYGLEVNCRVKVSPKGHLSEATANHLYRIAQEALTNAARHAHASGVEVYLLVTASKFLLRITDNGVGIGDAAKEGFGMGLKIMKYRANMIGAAFEITANHPHGTDICVTGQQATVVSES